jgi:hypothetical protein
MGKHTITADWDLLSLQSMDTAKMFFNRARRVLEESELTYTAADVVALAGHMVNDFKTAAMSVQAQTLAQSIDDFAATLADAIDSAAA